MTNSTKASKEDCKPQESGKTLKRSDDAYMQIESFESYELTDAIAFDMAIRNPKLIIRLNRIIDFYKKHRDKIDFIPEDYEYFNTAFEYRFHRRVQKIFHYWFDYIRYVYWIEPEDLFYAKMEEDTVYMLKSYNDFVNTDDGEDRLNNQYQTIQSDTVTFETSIDYENRHFFEDNENPSNDDILNAIKDYELDPCLFKRNNTISVDLSRPKLTVPAVFSKEFNLELNMALPKSELISYIEHIKDSYDMNKDNIKMIVELLGVNKEDSWFFGADTEGLQKRDRRKTPSERFADLFFIYDCSINGVTANKTIESLNDYWGWERNFPALFQIKTHRRYLKLARDFIENRKYQSLLIGI